MEAFIQRRFAEQYQARVTRFMPSLFGLEAQDGGLHGAIGLRTAGEGALYLEQYLDMPIEQAIRMRCAMPAERAEIVEVGNLAADGSGTARRLVVDMTEWLSSQGLRWVVFTGTPALLNSFQRLGLALHRICPADPARVGPELPAWGSYYDCRPQVMAGSIPEGYRVLAGHGAFAGTRDAALAPLPGWGHVACR